MSEYHEVLSEPRFCTTAFRLPDSDRISVCRSRASVGLSFLAAQSASFCSVSLRLPVVRSIVDLRDFTLAPSEIDTHGQTGKRSKRRRKEDSGDDISFTGRIEGGLRCDNILSNIVQHELACVCRPRKTNFSRQQDVTVIANRSDAATWEAGMGASSLSLNARVSNRRLHA